jgi:hypothetical protein
MVNKHQRWQTVLLRQLQRCLVAMQMSMVDARNGVQRISNGTSFRTIASGGQQRIAMRPCCTARSPVIVAKKGWPSKVTLIAVWPLACACP